MELSLTPNPAGDPREACDRVAAPESATMLAVTTVTTVTTVGPEPARLISTVKNWLQGA